jgi:DNA-3-methyladenine glycosylase I
MSENTSNIVRCRWVNKNPLYIAYHDTEWGVPLHDETRLFELLVLEGAQAGLAWETVLNKREHYRQVFDQFNPTLVALYDADKVAELMGDSGIIRNRAKILAAINNAQCFLEVQAEFGTFDRYLWQFVDGQPVVNHFASGMQLPAETPQSVTLSRALQKRGFKFVGPTICYAFMQATGMVNDHTLDCFLRQLHTS